MLGNYSAKCQWNLSGCISFFLSKPRQLEHSTQFKKSINLLKHLDFPFVGLILCSILAYTIFHCPRISKCVHLSNSCCTVHTNGYSVCVHPLCVLENGGVSECYTGPKNDHKGLNVCYFSFGLLQAFSVPMFVSLFYVLSRYITDLQSNTLIMGINTRVKMENMPSWIRLEIFGSKHLCWAK